MDNEEPVVVYTTNDPTAAELIRNALQEEGIVCEISGESQGGFTGVLEIELLTRAADAQRAREVIEQMEEQHRESKPDDEA
jgi:hypothetical protein